jgi:glycosyltransferase involved in cell wall biosynthesis
VCVGEVWHGANSNAFFRAFMRAGHHVTVHSDEAFVAPGWTSRSLRALRRLLHRQILADYNAALVKLLRDVRPDLLFVFKGPLVQRATLEAARAQGVVTINFFPDVSFTVHGNIIARALPVYDWVFTTKTFGLEDMRRALGVTNASFMPHGFDPETHCPMLLSASDKKMLECDASFIGTWSPKKQDLLEHVMRRLPGLDLKVWGHFWEPATGTLGRAIQLRGVTGSGYAKAITASKVNIAILSEVRSGASMGDQITSRTFHIPAAGGFMLHERTDEVLQYFQDGRDCAMFSSGDEMADRIAYYLEHDAERRAIAAAGRARSLASDYSIERKAEEIVAKAIALRPHTP